MNELGLFFEKHLPSIKKRKFRFILCYLLFLAYFSIPGLQIPILEYNTFRITSLMDQRSIENKLLFYPRLSWCSLNDVNPNILKGIISMEDGKFFFHKGIDWEELNKSLAKNKRRGRAVRGGSTITMQLAKNLYLSTEKSVFRKAKEFWITLRMEKELSKKGILRNYVNAVEWGNGLFGIKEASETYFGKKPISLNVNECARLAAVIPSPLVHEPNINSAYVSRRSAIILGRLNDIILFPDNQ
jgi:monofunctional biosynthetic peptidoglycan transglycosylase